MERFDFLEYNDIVSEPPPETLAFIRNAEKVKSFYYVEGFSDYKILSSSKKILIGSCLLPKHWEPVGIHIMQQGTQQKLNVITLETTFNGNIRIQFSHRLWFNNRPNVSDADLREGEDLNSLNRLQEPIEDVSLKFPDFRLIISGYSFYSFPLLKTVNLTFKGLLKSLKYSDLTPGTCFVYENIKLQVVIGVKNGSPVFVDF